MTIWPIAPTQTTPAPISEVVGFGFTPVKVVTRSPSLSTTFRYTPVVTRKSSVTRKTGLPRNSSSASNASAPSLTLVASRNSLMPCPCSPVSLFCSP